jgi:RNA polymerase sigma-70 factor (ECF subfamily)
VKRLTDTQILDLYEQRCENAIAETARQYGAYCTAIATRILNNREDAEECVNDAYLKAWNSIPPNRPAAFAAFLGRITKNLSLDKYKARKAAKRSGEEFTLMLSELEACIPSRTSVESQVESNILTEHIENFLSEIGKDDRVFFMRRYWHGDSIEDIARRFSVSQSRVMSSLFRTRKKLKTKLTKEGVYYG